MLTGVDASQVDKPTCPTHVPHKLGHTHMYMHMYTPTHTCTQPECAHTSPDMSIPSYPSAPLPAKAGASKQQVGVLAQHLGVDLALVEVTEKEEKVFFPIELSLGCFPTCVGRQNHLGTAEEVPPKAEGFPQAGGTTPYA